MSQSSGVADQFMARLGGWAQRNMDTLFMVARNLVSILVVTYQGKIFVLVSRHDDVREVMSLAKRVTDAAPDHDNVWLLGERPPVWK